MTKIKINSYFMAQSRQKSKMWPSQIVDIVNKNAIISLDFLEVSLD
jgi:hypothetical protein